MERNTRKFRIGEVIQDSVDKTITVSVKNVCDTKYGKKITKHTKILVHDEGNVGTIGNTVKIMECKPYSKRKRWMLVGVVS